MILENKIHNFYAKLTGSYSLPRRKQSGGETRGKERERQVEAKIAGRASRAEK